MSDKKILVHICCLPCFLHPYEVLKNDGYEIIGCFYNPNIHPSSEYEKRLIEVEKFFKDNNMRLIVGDYDIKEYFKVSNEFSNRCKGCYSLRLRKTFLLAEELGIKYITTTLFVSIYQPRNIILETGKKLSENFNASFLSYDFRLGYYEANKIAKNNNIYNQKYCGCIFSESERFFSTRFHSHIIG